MVLRILPVEGPLRLARRSSRKSHTAIAWSTYRSMQLFRIGSGGKRKAIRSSIRISRMSRVSSNNSTMNTSIPCSRCGLFDSKSQNFGEMTKQHLDVPNAHVYDATNPKARDFFWQDLAGKLFSLGWDAFWLDSAEPEEYWPHMGDAILQNKRISIGNGAEYTNIFPFMHTMGVQEHWKAATGRKRVFLLTRSAFLGQQRVGAAVWSGDVYGSYWGLRHQVAAGLNFALSGYPYWTTDIGG